MTLVGIKTAVISGLSHSDMKCPFCSERDNHNCEYNSFIGSENSSKELRRHMETSGMCTNERGKTIYPLHNNSCSTSGWQATARTFGFLTEAANTQNRVSNIDRHIKISGQAHHLIPGNESMKGSGFERWIAKSKNLIKSDVGYTVNCAANGIMLPGYPVISAIFRVGFGSLKPDTFKSKCAYVIMAKTHRQAHIGGHSAGYGFESRAITLEKDPLAPTISTPSDPNEAPKVEVSYAQECKNRCNLVADHVTSFTDGRKAKCDKKCIPEDDNEKYDPPYSIVHWMNMESSDMRTRISGPRRSWKDFVSKYARDFHALSKKDARQYFDNPGPLKRK